MRTLLCSRKFLVSKNFMDKKGGRRECHIFPSKICCLTVPGNFVGEPFCVSENFWYRKILWIGRGRGGVSQFSLENLLSHSTGKLRRRTLLCFRKFLVSKKVMDKKGGRTECHNFPSKICCLTGPEKFLREPFSV